MANDLLISLDVYETDELHVRIPSAQITKSKMNSLR